MVKRAKILHELDERDRKILALLQKDASQAQSEIARRVGLSTAAVHERIQKLEQAGVIRRWTVLLDAAAVGSPVTSFVEVFFEHPRHETAFLERVADMEEVQECHHVTGESSLLLKVRVADMESLQQLLLKELGAFEGVRQTRTVMALSTVKEETSVPLALEGGES